MGALRVWVAQGYVLALVKGIDDPTGHPQLSSAIISYWGHVVPKGPEHRPHRQLRTCDMHAHSSVRDSDAMVHGVPTTPNAINAMVTPRWHARCTSAKSLQPTRRTPGAVRSHTMDDKTLKAQLDAALAENAALKAQADRKVTLKVSEKGAVSVYGMGRFPVTLYQEQWLKLLAMGETITGFITTHTAVLESKGDDEATKATKAIARAKFRGVEVSTAPAAPGKPLVPPTTVAQPPVKRYSSRG